MDLPLPCREESTELQPPPDAADIIALECEEYLLRHGLPWVNLREASLAGKVPCLERLTSEPFVPGVVVVPYPFDGTAYLHTYQASDASRLVNRVPTHAWFGTSVIATRFLARWALGWTQAKAALTR